MPQREELELALKFAELPSLEKFIGQLEKIQAIRDDLSGRQFFQFFDKDVYETFKKILDRLDELKEKLKGVAKESDGFSKIRDEAEKLAASQAKLIKGVNDYLATLEAEQTKLGQVEVELAKIKTLKGELNKQTTDLIKNGNTESQVLVSLGKASSDLANKEAELIGIKKNLTAQIKEETKTQQQAVKQDQLAEGSLLQLRATLSTLTKEYDSLSRVAREGIQGNKLREDIVKISAETFKAEAATNRFQRKVGDYGNKFNGLQVSVNQFSRELPNLAFGVDLFIKSISNQFGAFSDEITKLKEANKALRAEGKPTQSVIGQIAGAVFSFQTLLSVGVTLLTVYGAKLIASFTGGTEAARKLREEQKKLNTEISLGLKEEENNVSDEKERGRARLKLIDEFEAKRNKIIRDSELEQQKAIEAFKTKQQEQIRKDQFITEEDAKKSFSDALTLAGFAQGATAEQTLEFQEKLAKESKERQLKATKPFDDLTVKNQKELFNKLLALKLKAENDIAEVDKDVAKRQLDLFKIEADAIKDQFELNKEVQEKISSNETLTLADREAAVLKIKSLNEKAAQDIEKAAKRIFGALAGFKIDKFDIQSLAISKNLIKDLNGITRYTDAVSTFENIVKDFNKNIQGANFELIAFNEESIKTLRTLTSEIQKLAAENSLVFESISAGDIKSREEFNKKRIQIEKDVAIQLQRISQSAEEEKLNKLIKLNTVSAEQILAIENSTNEAEKVLLQRQVNEQEAILLVANEALKQIKIKGGEERRKIAVQFLERERQAQLDNIQLQQSIENKAAEESSIFEGTRLKKREKAERNALNARIALQQEAVAALKASGATEDEIIKARIQLEDLLTQKIKAENDKRQKFIEKAAQFANDLFGSVVSGLNKKAETLSNEVSKQAENINIQNQRAAAGLENTLAFEETKRAELEKKQIEATRKAEKLAKEQTFFNLFANFSKDGETFAAASKAFAVLEIGDAIAAKLEHGGAVKDAVAEQSPYLRNNIFKGASHSGGGIKVEVEGDEGFFSKRKMKNLGLRNFYALQEIAEKPVDFDLAALSKTGPLANNYFAKESESLASAIIVHKVTEPNISSEFLSKLDDLKKSIDNKPVSSIQIDKFGNVINKEMRNAVTKITIHKRRQIG